MTWLEILWITAAVLVAMTVGFFLGRATRGGLRVPSPRGGRLGAVIRRILKAPKDAVHGLRALVRKIRNRTQEPGGSQALSRADANLHKLDITPPYPQLQGSDVTPPYPQHSLDVTPPYPQLHDLDVMTYSTTSSVSDATMPYPAHPARGSQEPDVNNLARLRPIEVMHSSPAKGSGPRVKLTGDAGATTWARIEPGFNWSARDTAGLATDMNIRVVGGVLMVSTRKPDSRARLEIDQTTVPLGPVEMPWRAGVIVNGRVSFETDHGSPEWRLARLRQDAPSRFSIATVENWAAITDDQPALAVAAAHLFVPEELDAVDAWRDRLLAYTSAMDIEMRRMPTLVHFTAGRLSLAGEVLKRIGVGTSNDSTSGRRIELVESRGQAETLDPGLRRIWIPTTPGSSLDEGSVVLDLVHVSGSGKRVS